MNFARPLLPLSLFLGVFGQEGPWDFYIDNLIAQTKDANGIAQCNKACIIGLDGGECWTTTGHANALNPSESERKIIATCFKSKDFTNFMVDGIYIEGTKYQFLREEDKNFVLAQKKGYGGLSIRASKTAIVIGHYKEGFKPENVNKGVGAIADYLESRNM